MDTHTDCREVDGVTVGLIDAIITMARLLARRDWDSSAVQEALEDLRHDEDVRLLLDENGNTT